MRRWMIWSVGFLGIVGCLLSGCSAATSVRPTEVQRQVLNNPGVAQWYAAHSAPRVFEGTSPTLASRWKRYRPSVIVDRSPGGFEVRLQANFGPQPRSITVAASEHSGEVLSVTSP